MTDKKPNKYNHEEIFAYLDNHPEARFTQFSKDTKIKMSGRNFNIILNKWKERNTNISISAKSKRRKSKVYYCLWSKNSKGISKEAKNLLKEFVQTLNDIGKLKAEVVDMVDPLEIEVREVR